METFDKKVQAWFKKHKKGNRVAISIVAVIGVVTLLAYCTR